MGWVIFVAGAVLSWGAYGALLHLGQTQLGNPLKALLCVGVAYFLIGVLLPVGGLELAGPALRFRHGRPDHRDDRRRARRRRAQSASSGRSGPAGLPIYVMPLVFGGAPIVNVAVSMMIHPPKSAINPMLFVGFLLASIGAGMVLYFRPTA